MEVPNPWLQYAEDKLILLEKFPETITGNYKHDFVLLDDREKSGFNEVYEKPLCLQTYLPPLPYVGNPQTAEVILLCKNGGLVGEGNDPEYKNEPSFIRQSLKSLKFESDYPIHYLDPCFKAYPGHAWWSNAVEYVVTRVLENYGSNNEDLKRRTIGKIAGIQWLPYHSKSLSINKKILDVPLHSLSYTRWMLENALNGLKQPELVLIYGNGNKDLWNSLLGNGDQKLFSERAISKKPEYGGSINVKRLEPAYYKRDDLTRIIKRLM